MLFKIIFLAKNQYEITRKLALIIFHCIKEIGCRCLSFSLEKSPEISHNNDTLKNYENLY